MAALRVIISMFLVLFYAGVTHQTPHNGIINNTVVYDNNGPNNNRDVDNNVAGNIRNSTDSNNNIVASINNDTDVYNNKNDAVNNTLDMSNKMSELNENQTKYNKSIDKETFLNEINEMKKKIYSIENKFHKITAYFVNPINDESNLYSLEKALDELEESITTTTTSTTTEAPTTIEATEAVAVNSSCLTGWNDVGECYRRKFCDYGTEAIDRTLYAKAGYQSTCTDKDTVCCPKGSQLPIVPDKYVDYDDFSSDEDSDY